MTVRTTVTRGSRSRWLRLPPRVLFIVGILVVLAVAAVTALLVTRAERGQRYGAQAAMVAELRRLVGDNALFMRPGLTSDGGPSWAASAYGLSALRATGTRQPSLPDPAALRASLGEQLRTEPVWGRWYAVMVERATGATFVGDWAAGIVGEPIPAGDPAVRVAAVAAVADVVAAKGLPVPVERRQEFAGVLAEARAAGPFTRCRALQAATALGLDPAGWSIPAADEVRLPDTFEVTAAMDGYGSACLAQQLGRPLTDAQRARLLRWLEPHLTMNVRGAELEAYFVTQAWLAAGGEPSRLGELGRRIGERLDSASGLLREHVVRLGTLENTYYVAVLADTVDAFADIAGRPTLDAVRALVPQLRARTAMIDLLMAAAVLRYADRPDAALEAEASAAAEAWLAGGVNRNNVTTAARVTLLLQQLGRRIPPIRANLFDVVGAEERYLAWTLLGISHHLSNGDEARRRYGPVVAEVGAALNDPAPLLVKEVAAAAVAAGSGLDRNNLPQPLARWTAQVRGCDGFRTLYRPVLSEHRCSLEATVQMLNAGLTTA